MEQRKLLKHQIEEEQTSRDNNAQMTKHLNEIAEDVGMGGEILEVV